jgi:hypothetical protein
MKQLETQLFSYRLNKKKNIINTETLNPIASHLVVGVQNRSIMV